MVVGVDGTGDLAAARPYSAVYAVYAISSLDTEGSLRHGTQTAFVRVSLVT